VLENLGRFLGCGAVHPDNASRNTNDGGVVRHGFHDNRPGADLHVIAEANVAEHLRAAADDDVVTQRRMALAFFLARTAQRDALVHQYVIADLRCLAYHDAHAMVDEEPSSDRRARMDFDPGEEPADLGDQARQQRNPGFVKPVGEPVGHDSVKPRIAEQDFDHATRSRIIAENSIDLFPEVPEHVPPIMTQHEGRVGEASVRSAHGQPGAIAVAVERHWGNPFLRHRLSLWLVARSFLRGAIKNLSLGRDMALTRPCGSEGAPVIWGSQEPIPRKEGRVEPRSKRDSNREALFQATEKTASRVRELRSRLDKPVEADSAEREEESVEELERKLHKLFEQTGGKTGATTGLLKEIRERVLDGVAERILREWESSEQDVKPFEDEVVARLIARVMEGLNPGPGSKPQ